MEFAERVSQWRENGLTLRQMEEAAVNLWEVSLEDLPLLRLAIQLVAASGDVVQHPRSDSAASSRGWQCARSASVTDRDSSYCRGSTLVVVCRELLTLTLFTI